MAKEKIYIEKIIKSSKNTGVYFDYNDKKYFIKWPILEEHDINELNYKKLEKTFLELDLNFVRSFGTKGDWYSISRQAIIKIYNSPAELFELNQKLKREAEIAKKEEIENMFVEDDQIEQFEIEKDNINFEKIYENIDFYEINPDGKEEISQIEKLIHKSIKLTKTKYDNGVIKAKDYTISLLNQMSDTPIENLITGKVSKLKIKKFKFPAIPKSLIDNENGIVKFLENKNLNSFMTKTDNQKFFALKMSLTEFRENIEKRANAYFVKIRKIVKEAKLIEHETGQNPFKLAWPYLIGRNEKGTFFHCPLAYRNVDIKESLNEYEISLSDYFSINTYPILKNYADSNHKVNNIESQHNTLKDLLVEFYKHRIKITAPETNEIIDYSQIKELKKNKYNAGFFVLSNEALFTLKESDEYIFYDLKNIINEQGNFSIPEQNFNEIIESKVSTYRDYIDDVDHSKAIVIENALKSNSVIYGPPGTGKSQSITSIIGKLIGDGKNSIFVAEKATAIEVIESNLKKMNMDYFVLNLNNQSKTDFAMKIDRIHALINDNTKGSSLSEIPKIDFAKEWVNRNANKNHLINLFKENHVELNDSISYINLTKSIISHFGSSKLTSKEIFNKINEELDKWRQKESKILEIGQLESEKIMINNEKSDLIKSFEEKKNKNLESFKSSNLVQIFIKSFEEIVHSFDKDIEIEEFTRKISIKKPLFIKKYILKNRREIMNLMDLVLRSHKLLDDTNNRIFSLDEEIANKSTQIKNIEKFLEQIDEELFERFNSYGDLSKYNSDIIDYLLTNENVLLDVEKEWINHIEDRQKHIVKVRKLTVNNYVFHVRKKLDEQNLWSQYYAFIKHVKNYLNKRGQNVSRTIKNGFKIARILFASLMMNPDLVSKIFPTEPNLFDYAIFDEASQMRLHKAVPTLHRGEIAIVAGDEKQLGPTDYFTDLSNDEDYELNLDNDTSLNNDTILNYAKDNYKGVMLMSHYRSKSKDLIEFSNDEFYDGKIMIADSPESNLDGRPPIIVEEMNGIWSTYYHNIVEAKRAADLVEQYRLKNLTVGVITFNDTQANMIQSFLDEKKIGNLLGLDDFFIKPIKNVQGDERDIIIFSITYGRYENSDKYTTSFGQFSKEKINVAITRSKYRMHILKSIPSSSIKANDDNKRVFKNWLQFLEEYSKSGHNIELHENQFRSNFESDFFEIIESILPKKFVALANYSVGEKEIDIVIYDNSINEFVGAIELDGAKYHSSNEQIINDYERQIFLENMGWKFYRIPFWDFYSNRHKSVEKSLNFFNIQIENI